MRISKISRKSVFYSLFAIAASNTFLQLLGFIYRVFLSRITGAEGMGVYQLVMPFYSVLNSVSIAGLTVAVARLSAERSAMGDAFGARASVSLARRCFFILAFFLAFITLSGKSFVSEGILGDKRTEAALPLAFACLFLTGIENIFKNYFYGVGRVAPQITSEISEQIIRAGAVAALLLIKRPTDAGEAAALIFLGMTISELSSATVLTAFYRPEKKKLSRARGEKLTVREVLAIAAPVSGAATLGNLMSSFNSVLIPRRLIAAGLSRKLATENFGVMFGMTMPLLSFPIAFIASLTSVMVPKISEQTASGNASGLRRKVGKTIHATSLLALPCIAFLIPLGEPLCRLIFNHPRAGGFMLPLCAGTLLSYYSMTTAALLNGAGLQGRAALYTVIGGIVQLFFTYLVGFPGIGISGFVIGYVVSSGVTAVLNFSCLIRKFRLRPRFSNWFVTPLLAAAFSALICDIVHKATLARAFSDAASAIIALAVGGFAYAVALSALGTNLSGYIKSLIPKER